MERVATAPIERPAIAEKDIVRFDIHQIIQHIGLMATFVVLALTGLPLKFHNWSISQWWIGVWGGIERTSAIHYFAAWAMVFFCVYHLLYIAYTTLVLKRPFPTKIIPSGKDFKDLFQELGYFLGLKKERPEFDRFNLREKFDYWAIFWGMPVMAISGFILMYPVFTTRFLPGWTVPVSLVAHSDEAILAVGWIFIVHLVFNHLAPGLIPLNKSIFTGRVPNERYRREHPLEYERLFGAAERADRSSEAAEGTDRLSEAAEKEGGLSEAAAEEED